MPENCSTLKVYPQFSSTCWFNAILMCLFYSQGGRLVTKQVMNKNKKLYDKIIYEQCMTLFDKKYNPSLKMKPEYILRRLYQLNNKLFDYNNKISNAYTPVFKNGVDSVYDIRSILEYL